MVGVWVVRVEIGVNKIFYYYDPTKNGDDQFMSVDGSLFHNFMTWLK